MEKDIQQYNINELRWDIGYVLQQIALFPHMTIAENIAVVPEMRKWSKEKIKARVDELLQMVGLDQTYIVIVCQMNCREAKSNVSVSYGH